MIADLHLVPQDPAFHFLQSLMAAVGIHLSQEAGALTVCLGQHRSLSDGKGHCIAVTHTGCLTKKLSVSFNPSKDWVP